MDVMDPVVNSVFAIVGKLNKSRMDNFVIIIFVKTAMSDNSVILT